MGTNMEPSTSSIHGRPVHWNFVGKLIDNPIIAKELKGRMRGRQGFVILSVYLLLLSVVIGGMYLYSINNGNISRTSPNSLQAIGKLVFNTVVMLELLMIAFIGPALTSGAISSERERGTFDLLRTSLLSSRALVLGKLGSVIIYLLLLIFTALPLQSLAFFLGGVGMAEMIISIVILAASAFLFCTLGLYFSSLAKRTLIATVLSYTSMILPVIILVFLFYLLVDSGLDISSLSIEDQGVVLTILWVLFSTNPFTASLISQLMLVEEQSLFLIYPPDFSLVLFSPWIIYVIFAVTMTALMIWLIVLYLDRYER